VEGEGIIVPYASIIDNATAEAIFVPADAATNLGAAARAMLSGAVARETPAR
jgi:hypothetical protein